MVSVLESDHSSKMSRIASAPRNLRNHDVLPHCTHTAH